MRLPKVLAVFVVLLLSAGSATAISVGSRSGASSSGSSLANGVALASRGVAAGAAPTLKSGSSALTGSTGTAALLTPAAGVPVGGGLSASSVPSLLPVPTGQVTTLPVPRASSLPSVPALRTVDGPDAIVLLHASITTAQTAALKALRGVSAVEEVDTGTVDVSGDPAVAFGVDPGSFRAFTPAASASSNRLWQYVAGGSLVSSYEMATDRRLKLGSEAAIAPAGSGENSVRGWLGAFASIGLPGVDLLVSNSYSSVLGLTRDSGLVVSAPQLSGQQLQSKLAAALSGATIELLHPNQLPESISGNSLNAQERQQVMSAALSRVGQPYVWGGAGPDVFDCSGLVQWAYRQAGILMPRTAAEQFLTGAHLPLADAQPGDLLFWTYDPSDPGFVDHTAIYLGNGMMVVAPHAGLDVEVVQVPTDEFAGAVRVLLR